MMQNHQRMEQAHLPEVLLPMQQANSAEKNQSFETSREGYSANFPDDLPMQQMNSMDKLTGYAGHFPEDLPARSAPPPAAGKPWKQRLRAFLTFSTKSYSIIHTPDGAARIRHLAMISILLLRTAMSALSILSAIIKGSIAGIVIYSLLALLGFWFTATCLAIIGDAEGDKRLKSLTITRLHFDVFLGACVLIHAGLIVLFFFGLSGWGLELTSVGMWFAILGVAWIAGWQPELPQYQRTWVS